MQLPKIYVIPTPKNLIKEKVFPARMPYYLITSSCEHSSSLYNYKSLDNLLVRPFIVAK